MEEPMLSDEAAEEFEEKERWGASYAIGYLMGMVG